MTIVLVTNLVQQAQRLADRAAFLNDGRAGRGRSDRRDLLRAPGQRLTFDYVRGDFG